MKLIYRWPTFFERLIYYFLLPDLLVKIVYEIMLRVPAMAVNQPKQFMFYGAVALEYIIFAMRPGSLKPVWRQLNPVFVLLLVMMFHGVVIGLWRGNPFPRMIIDSVNVFVVLANIIILSDPTKIADTDFERIFTVNRFYAAIMVFLSIVAMAVNPSSVIALGGATAAAVSTSLIFTEILMVRTVSSRSLLKVAIGLTMLAAAIQGWNRTTLVFVLVATILIMLRNVTKTPFRVAYFAMGAVVMCIVAFAALPQDSALARRINGLEEVDFSSRTGSIGEREAESDAVSAKIAELGKSGTIFGAGHGASYDVKYTWKWKLSYSNAHFGWVLFYLRYGSLGYVYLTLWLVALVFGLLRTWRSSNPASTLICMLSIWNVGYLGTYSYFSFFIAGIPFVRPASRRQSYSFRSGALQGNSSLVPEKTEG